MKRSIAINAGSLGASKITSDIISFALLVMIARVLGAEDFGIYGLGMAVGGLVSLIVAYGWVHLVVREVASRRQSEARLIGTVLAMQALALLVAAVLVPVALRAAGYTGAVVAGLHAMVLYQCLVRVLALLRAWYNAHEESRIGAGFDVLEKVLTLGIGASLLFATRSVWPTLLAFPVSAFVVCVVSFVVALRRYGAPDFSGVRHDLRSQATAAAPFFVVLLAATVLDRAGVLLLGWLHGVGTVGVYSAPDRLVAAGVAALTFAAAAFQPVFARLWRTSPEQAQQLLCDTLGLVLLVTVPAALLGVILAEPVMLMLFGAEYVAGVEPLRVLALMLVPASVQVMLMLWLLATHGHRLLLLAQFFGLCGFGLLLWALVPAGAETGLAWARALGLLVLAAFMVLALWVRGQRAWPLRTGVVALGGGVAGYAAARAGGDGLHEALAAALALGVYLVVLAAGGRLHLRRAWRELRAASR